ncbi:MAG: hypothetical protein O8C63_03650 [Candidatus Methanoperedens sp.]|nr:hypothetical protein [Candidatus Methanoperedens sp.]
MNELMTMVEYDEFMERQYRFLQEKDKFVSLDEYESMKSTLEVLSDTELLQQIEESKEDYKAGRYKKLHDLIKESEKE